MKVLTLLASFVLVLSTASCAPEETYKGKPLSEWLKLAKDNDSDTRMQAMGALGMLKADSAKETLLNAAQHDYSGRVRLAALKEISSRLSDAELLAILDDVAKSDASTSYPGDVTLDPFIYGVKRLGPKAAPLVPTLLTIRGKMDKSVDKELVDEMITDAGGSPPKKK